MTELKDSRFTELLPSDLKNDTETQAFAYAVSRQVQQVIRFADAACIYIAIDGVPEPVLDLLAVELRTPVYKQTYSVAIKRALVKESLIFYDQMGTPAAVNRIIEAVFGVGQIGGSTTEALTIFEPQWEESTRQQKTLQILRKQFSL